MNVKFIRNIIIIVIVLVLGFYGFLNRNNTKTSKITNINNFKMPTTEEIITKLCSNEFSGRVINSKGNELTVEYIENLFSKLKLEPVFKDSYLHEFESAILGNSDENGVPEKQTILKLNNVVGKISGKNNKNAIILGAHFDGYGKVTNPNTKKVEIFRGALDNASGVATILNIAHNLKTRKDTLDYDVIICGFNGELTGYKMGSEQFVKDIKHLYDKIFYINIDCVGAKKAGPIALKNISRVKDSCQLYDSIKNIFKKHNIDYEDIYSSEKVKYCFEKNFFGVSDYKYFEKNNIPNIHIAQSKISDLILKVEDTPEILDYNLIDALALSLSDFTKNNELKFIN